VKKTCPKSKVQAFFPLKKMSQRFEKGFEKWAKARPGEKLDPWKNLLIIA
jgi:hypothetical protein